MSVLIKSIAAALIFSHGLVASAHGEHKPGPHGGSIKMPGAFHLEVLSADNPNRGRELRIYMLDLQFSNPLVEETTLSVEYGSENSPTRLFLACTKSTDHYYCPLPTTVDLNEGFLTLDAQRTASERGKSTYLLPLTFNQGRI